MLHGDILTISYKHRYEIQRIFKEIIGLYGISHFSLDLVRPDGEMIFFSSTPSHGYEVCSRGYGPYDGAISPNYYCNFEFYWWRNAVHKAYDEEINYIREIIHGFKHGFMLVRKWDNFYLIYSFATRSNHPAFSSIIVNNLNELLAKGDNIYTAMRDTYGEYAGTYVPPTIDKFYPFQGGKPVARYSSAIVLPSKNPAPHLKLVVDNNINS